MNKYLFEEEELSKELLILLSVFNSSKINNKILLPLMNSSDILEIFPTEFFLIQENLISSAIKLRVIDDQFIKHSKNNPISKNIVGSLNEKSQHKGLIFREACNKIIHAIKFTPVGSKFYLPKIILEGEKNDVKWLAKLDIIKYVSCGLQLAKLYDEDWEVSQYI